jgi:hypothetical protein
MKRQVPTSPAKNARDDSGIDRPQNKSKQLICLGKIVVGEELCKT